MRKYLYMLSASLLLMVSVSGCSDSPEARHAGQADAVGDTTSPDPDSDATSPDAGDTTSPNLSECAVTDPNDLPSLDQLEANCDEDDATVIFVDPEDGDDSRSGTTPSKAVQSLAVALEKTTEKRVYILAAAGTFEEQVTLKEGVGIFGGFDAKDGWIRNINDVTTEIDPSGDADAFDATTTDYISVIAQDLIRPATLDGLTIRGVDAENEGASSYVIWAHNADGLRVQDATIIAGKGKDGQAGAKGADGKDRTCDADGGEGGSAVLEAAQLNCGADGGNIGTAEDGHDGQAGALGSGGDSPSHAGEGGRGGAHACPMGNATACAATIGSGDNGKNGGAGESAEHGAPGEPSGSVNNNGLWLGDVGELATDGENGTGGGGGGAGGTCAFSGGIGRGDDGGRGGDGGCGGTHGENGQSGGASFGIFASHSELSLSGLVIQQGEAGDGGDGAKGGAGQPATNTGQSLSSGRLNGGGQGGDGGFGGDGADGGDGAGGCGGPSIGIAKHASNFEVPAGTEFSAPTDPSEGGENEATSISGSAPERCDGLVENEYDFGG